MVSLGRTKWVGMLHRPSSLMLNRQSTAMMATKSPVLIPKKSLSKLPLPKLEPTVQSFLQSILPLSDTTSYEATQSLAQDFIKNENIHALHERLAELDKKEVSWIERIWLEKAYLACREPLMVHSNYWCQFQEHPAHIGKLIAKPPPRGVMTDFQIKRASGLILNFLKYHGLCSTKFSDSHQHQHLFATRVPGPQMDQLKKSSGKHIIVMARNQLFKLDIDPAGFPTLLQLEKTLLDIARSSQEHQGSPAIGVLTAVHRDLWSKAHHYLSTLDSRNAQYLQDVQDALFVVCLDDKSVKSNLNDSHRIFFHNFGGENRWFDKSLQLIVSSNGRAGLNAEHSPVDATITGSLVDYVLKNEPAVEHEMTKGTGIKFKYSKAPLTFQRLDWVVDSQVESFIAEAKTAAQSLSRDVTSVVVDTDIYGSRYIKEVGKLINIALISSENKPRFFCANGDSISLYDEKRRLFQKAIESHVSLKKAAASGQGIDRYLLGLKSMIRPGENVHPLFNDPNFLESLKFRLSTSNVSPATRFYGGFGPVTHDGYGINYAIDVDSITFTISDRTSCVETNSYEFRNALVRTLADVMILFPKRQVRVKVVDGRSHVWGFDWKEKHHEAKVHQHYLAKMKSFNLMKASQDYHPRRMKMKARQEQEKLKSEREGIL